MKVVYLQLFILFIFEIINNHVDCKSYLEIFINENYGKLMPNVSYGYQDNNGHQCRFNSKRSSSKMSYTPNRVLQSNTIQLSNEKKIQLGIVLALGGHSSTYYDYGTFGSINGIMAVWDGWVDNFLSVTAETTTLIMLFDERDYRRMNMSISRKEYLDIIVIKNMGATAVNCVRYKHRFSDSKIPNSINFEKYKQHMSKGCTNELTIDQGYYIYYITFPNGKTAYIFVSLFLFPPPDWAKSLDEEYLYVHWRPTHIKRFKTNYGYVKLTNWYSYHLLTLKILDFFDYVGKLDNDVSFMQAFPFENLPKLLIDKNAKVLSTHQGFYNDAPQVSQGVRECIYDYINNEIEVCKRIDASNDVVIPRGYSSHPDFWVGNLNATFRAHFLIVWLGLYTSPEVIDLARFWNDRNPRGMWDFRWGDQQWWPRPLAMFSEGNISSDIYHCDILDDQINEVRNISSIYLWHKEWPRFGTLLRSNYFNINGTTKEDRKKIYEIAAKKLIY